MSEALKDDDKIDKIYLIYLIPEWVRASLTERIFSFGDAPLRRYPVYTESHL